MNRTLVALAAAAAVTLAAVTSVASAVPAEPVAEEADVEVGDSYFDPTPLTVFTGTTVVWTHVGNLPHSITADDGSFDSHPGCLPVCMVNGETFSRTFPEPGVVAYYCKVHGGPGGSGMSGVINVVQPTGFQPTTVDAVGASVAGGSVNVTGSATFRGEAPNLVAEDAPGDAPVVPQAGDVTGVDLLGGYIYQPDPSTPEIVLEWRVTALPASGSIPEVIRYGFPARTATTDYQIQGKFSNLVSTTFEEDPQGHVEHAAGTSFQLRGDCGPHPTIPGTHCRHIAWLEGEFDVEAGAVRAHLPIGAPFAPTIVPGAVLQPNPAAFGGNVVASYQAVASTDATQDNAAWDAANTYRVPTRAVRLGIVPAGAPAQFTVSGTVGPDGSSFSGSLSTAGLAPGSYDVWAEACFGTNCGTARRTITL